MKKKFFSLVIIAIAFLSTFIPVGRFLYGISTAYYSTEYHWGPMGGSVVDEEATNNNFFILMAIYLGLVVTLYVVFYKRIKK